MEALLHQDKSFDKIIYTNKEIHHREFENCNFNNCDFSNSNYSFNRFTDCVFTDCNLSGMKLESTRFADCAFKNCKLLGIHFVECEDFMFSVRFDNCSLDYSSFMYKKMAKTVFIGTSLKGVSFASANLSNAVFEHCDLDGTIFRETLLTGANFITARNYIIDPELNQIKKAKFSLFGLPGLLLKYDINITTE